MPAGIFYKAPVPKKSKRRNKRYKKRRPMIRYTGSGLTPSLPFSKSFKFRTRYVDRIITLDPTTGGVADSHVFSLNGLYDPDVTGTGHQPIGFDQLMGTMYDHYTVIGARIRVSASNLDASYPQDVILQLKDTSTTSTDVPDIIENGMVRWCTLAPSGSGGSTKALQLNCSMNKFFGRKVMQDDIFRGSSSTNPTEQVYCHIIGAPQVATDTGTIRCTVEIDYVAILTEPKQLTGS